MDEQIKGLKAKLQKFNTKELLGIIGLHFITFGNTAEDISQEADIFNKTKLVSPQKQYLYLAGLLMSTEDLSSNAKDNDSARYDEIEDDIQDITSKYSKNFLNINIGDSLEEQEELKKNLVSLDAFTSYFDTGILRYDEQTLSLMKKLYTPFDAYLEELTSLTIDDYIQFYQLVSESFRESLDAPKKPMQQIVDFLDSLNPDAPDIELQYQRMLEFAQGGIGNDLQKSGDNLFTISTAAIYNKFGKKKGQILIDTFSLERRERPFLYYNSQNPFVEQPLCWVDKEQTLFIVHPQFVLNAIFNYVTEILENPKNTFSEKYKRTKANIVENLFVDGLKELLGGKAQFYTNVCEEPGTKEHDILVEFGNYIIVAEVKASKVREPFFNPEKAFVRIRDHFYSDSGIGGAYKQAIHLKKLLEKGDTITLYENKSPFSMHNLLKKTILPVVFTLNQFGGIAVNTSLLIEPEDGQPYPWVCNLHDLQNVAEINRYLKKTPQDFIDYIIWRNLHHCGILSSDELDVIEGYYLEPRIKNAKDENIFFLPNGPSLIDKIYFEKHNIAYAHPLIDGVKKKHIKIGVNEPCPCGSGKNSRNVAGEKEFMINSP